MTPWQTFWAGVAPDHAPALVISLLFLPVWLLARIPARRRTTVAAPLPLTQRWAVAGLTVTGAVHMALPIGDHDRPALTAGFLAVGAGYLWLAMRIRHRRRWRLLTAVLVGLNLIGYLVIVTAGREGPDQVGIATALDELLLLALALADPAHHRLARAAASTATVAGTVLVGAVVWVGSFAAARDAAAPDVADTAPSGGTISLPGHDHAGRAEAGVIARPPAAEAPTDEQRRAADRLAARTKAGIAEFTDIRAALAAGYKINGAASGSEVHLENKAYIDTAHILDSAHPQSLVYVVADGKATLLGAMYQMPVAGMPGPEPGGPITHWHSHNGCVTALPPGFGIASPFGNCTALSIALTPPDMMHVWTAPVPGGPYADTVDPAWARAYNAHYGLPWTP